jgi:hypothetical protein
MKKTGHGRPPAVIALAALTFLLLAAPGARAASPYGNVVEVRVPRPGPSEVLLARADVVMQLRGGVTQGDLGSLRVRRAGGTLPAGYSVAGVQARPRGKRVTVRLAAVRSGSAARAGAPLRVRLRIGGSRVAYRRVTTATVTIAPRTSVRRTPDCRGIVGESAGWRPVSGIAAMRIGPFTSWGARAAVGAAQQIACDRRLPTIPTQLIAGFLEAVDPDFDTARAAVEGFFATWVKNADGTARICVFVRGGTGGTGDALVGTTTQPFTLSEDAGVARTVTEVAGEGEYAFRVRWRQPDGTFHTSESAVRVPAGGGKGDDPPAPYSAAGVCS